MARAVLRKGSMDLVRYDHRFHPLARRMRLISVYKVSVVFDVGANVGQYGEELRRLGFRGRIVSFEPLSAAFRRLEQVARQDGHWEVLNMAVGDSAGTKTINVAANSYSSSFLQMLPAHLRSAPDSAYVGLEEVAVRTLDSLVDDRISQEDRVFVKIDTQGYESRVLQGARRTLQRAVGVQLELSVTPLYEGELPLEEMLHSLKELGFTLMAVEPGFSDPTTGRLLQFDGLFFRDSAPP